MHDHALICVDFINEIVNTDGKLSAKGYASFCAQNQTFAHLAEITSAARQANGIVIHVRLGFANGYEDHPINSPLFGGAKNAGILRVGTWSTEFYGAARPAPDDIVITKPRVSAFYATPLEVVLRTAGVQRVDVCGVATDLAVEACVRDAHDRDFHVRVLARCCAAATDADHKAALAVMSKMATIIS